jgi:hypothetical protein
MMQTPGQASGEVDRLGVIEASPMGRDTVDYLLI